MTYERVDRIAIVGSDAPGDHLTDYAAELARALEDGAIDAAVIVVGQDDRGPSPFFASDEAAAWVRRGHHAIDRVARSTKPVVAAIGDDTAGPGFEIALACHGAVVAEGARLTLPAVNVGLIPSLQGLPRLAARTSIARAIEVGVQGRAIDARDALALGLAQRITSRDAVLEGAVTRARDLAARRVERSDPRRSWVRSIRALVDLRSARRWVKDAHRGHISASERALDVLAAFATRGFEAAIEAEIKAFSELAVMESTRTSIAVHASLRARGGAPGNARYGDAILRPFIEEARALVTRGVPARDVYEALVAWGFPKGSRVLDEVGALGDRGGQGSTLHAEEIQMPCVLRLVNEAIRCLDEGVIASADEGDLDAIVTLGFPLFRGGPFRYVDAVGPREIVKRLAPHQKRFGERFAPAPGLVAMAARDARFYPR